MAINNNFNGTELVKTADKLSRLKVIGNDESLKLKSAVEDYIFEAGREKHKSPRIVCAGIYNSGKSTLLNALTGGNNFEVGDIPTTSAVEEVELNGYTYVDTPGLNANNMDNETAQRAFKDADVIVFVSNIMSGGLKSDEAEYLKKLVDILGGTDNLKSQTIFVMSNKDQVSEDDAEKIAAEHSRNIEKTVGYKPDEIFIYDAVTYETGVKEVSDVLINHSGINELKKLITEKANTVSDSMEKIRENRIAAKATIVVGLLCEIKQELESKLLDLENAQNKRNLKSENIKRAISNCKNVLSDAKNNLKEVNNEKIGVPWIFLGHHFGWLEEKKKYNLQKKISDYIQSAYDEREQAANKAVESFIKDIKNIVAYERNEKNFYYKKENQANEVILSCNEILKEADVILPTSYLVPLEIDKSQYILNESKLYNDLIEGVVKYDHPYRVDDYISKVEIHKDDFNGIFNIKYRCYGDNHDIERDMQKAFNSNCSRVVNYCTSRQKKFCEQLISLLEKRINEIINGVNSAVDNYGEDVSPEIDYLQNLISDINKYII